MVNRFLPVLLLSTVLILPFLTDIGRAQTRIYHLNQEWAKIWIREDGSIDLFYNISITLESGSSINYLEIGQPKDDYTIGPALDQYNNTLSTSKYYHSGTDYGVQVNLHSPLSQGNTIWLTIITNVAGMIHEENETYVGMEFTPTWWSYASVADLRVQIVAPAEVGSTMIGALENWDNIQQEPDGRWTVYWQRQNLAPDQRLDFGISFPKGFTSFIPKPSGFDIFVNQYLPPILGVAFLIAIVAIVVVFARKRAYVKPTVSIETLGIKRGLTAVEASYLLDMKPPKIVTEILYSLLLKRAVWAESVKPSVKLRVMDAFKDKKGPSETALRYYEIDFLDAVKKDGTLDEQKLAKTFMFLRETVEEKMRGYQRKETVEYYKQIVAKAWGQVEQAGTPALASTAYNEQLLWLFLDPNYQSRTETIFRDQIFQPNPMWFWYWYGYTHYSPHPSSAQPTQMPTQTTPSPSIPGADFANNIVTAVETTSNNIVNNLEKFANSILPYSVSKTSSQPAHHHADCVCACAACACACACVSCACACAGGGVGIKKGGLRP